MVGAPDVDQLVGLFELLHVIGGVGAEIGPAAVGLLDRPVLIVAERGRAEQGQLDRLPILRRLALGRRQGALVDQPLLVEQRERPVDRARLLHLGFGGEQIVMDAEPGEVGPDQLEHRRDRPAAEELQPFAFGRIGIGVAIFGGERLADRLQIVAGIEAFRDLADLPPERLAVAQVRRAGEHVDLPAGVVDIIFADHLVARIFEQAASASPTTAPRQWPMCIGPVGLAETYSTLTVRPPPMSERP